MARRQKGRTFIEKPPPDESQLSFFAQPVFDVALKDERETMERPFLCVHRKPSDKPIKYRSSDGSVAVDVFPHPDFGLATINDWDIVIWAASVIWDQINETGRAPSRTIGFHPHNLLRAIGREPGGGTSYQKLAGALDRLQSTTVKTSIRAEKNVHRTFSWIDEWERVDDGDPRNPKHWSITLCKWLYEGITDETKILSLHPEYFRLSNETDKWLYRLARKHAGQQRKGFRISLKELHRKNGTTRAFRKWKYDMKPRLTNQIILDYSFDMYENRSGDLIVHMIRGNLAESFVSGPSKEEQVKQSHQRALKAARLPPEKRQAYWKAELGKHDRRKENASRYADLHQAAREQHSAVAPSLPANGTTA